jgi:hypothetical protein
VARNTVGYGAEFPSLTAQTVSDPLPVNVTAAAAPSTMSATVQSGPAVAVSARDNATNETGFVLERAATAAGPWVQIATAPALKSSGGTVSFLDANVVLASSYAYRVGAVNLAAAKTYSPAVSITVGTPAVPSAVSALPARSGNGETITVNWADNADNETAYVVQWSASSAFTVVGGSITTGPNVTAVTTPRIARQTWYVRVMATNALGDRGWSAPVLTVPSA